MCICILLSYQVCCFVTNVVKIIPLSECLFLCPFCIVSAWERNGKRANSHRVYMYTFVLSESKRRVKPSADVRVVIPSKKNTTQTTPVTLTRTSVWMAGNISVCLAIRECMRVCTTYKAIFFFLSLYYSNYSYCIF